jgi:cell division protein FtsZ
MIPYNRDPQQTIPTSAVKIIGLGGAGANMLERIALDGLDGAELLALNTDIRTLAACIAREKIQLGVNLTKGLGAGGDPELGHQAVLEAEDQIRASIKGRRIVFLCTGLGGGTGSGAAPIVTRVAREEGAFVVVFATMPFAFEGRRRREQAETALNELAVLSNALVTFDNNRMGELVLAKQGIHEAFAAADHMICESIKAVIRLVIRPGLINVGLDDLMSALRTNRSRCLFGSGLASGKDRASKALKNALNSPLLDQGALLKDAQTVLVHLSGGEDLTLFEIELLMQRLQKFVPDKAHVLFGAAIDPAMGDSLSITLISALPEDSLAMAPRDSLSRSSPENPILDPSQGFTPPPVKSAPAPVVPEPEPEPEPEAELEEIEEPPAPRPSPAAKPVAEAILAFELNPTSESTPIAAPPVSTLSKFRKTATNLAAAAVPSLFDNERPFAEPDYAARVKVEEAPKPDLDAFTFQTPAAAEPKVLQQEPEVEDAPPVPVVSESNDPAVPNEIYVEAEEDPEPIEAVEPEITATGTYIPLPKRRPNIVARWGTPKPDAEAIFPDDIHDEVEEKTPEPAAQLPEAEPPKLKLGIKSAGSQNELSLDSAPRGRFEGESPNVFDGEDLDLPPFLRKKK